MNTIAPPSVMTLSGLIVRERKLPIGYSADQAKRALAPPLALVRAALDPASPEEIAEGLQALAAVFSAKMPTGMAFDLYIGALQGIGVEALRRALAGVVSTHRYPSMPLPADVLRAAESPQNVLRLYRERLERALALLP
jgi:hypothetical protein